MDLGFGRPKHAGPIVSGNNKFVFLLGNGDGERINVWKWLENVKMERLVSCVFWI